MDVKLQKYAADCGLMSRRAAEKEIEAGNFEVNGKVASIGMRVDPQSDAVTYKGRPLNPSGDAKVYIMLNKPRGVVTTMSDEKGRRCIADVVDIGIRVFPVGRLDLNSEGLILLTNDGEFANAVSHPSGEINKKYRVVAKGKVSDQTLEKIRAMRTLDGEKLNPVEVEKLAEGDDVTELEFTLSEGKNREIRRICESVGVFVKKLKRISIGPLRIGSLRPGEYRELTHKELAALRNTLNKE
ncbi:MAG: rRNA pseudouridine synthase [Clostridia bacterium]|nr:rRNA pseudouridine synthase [Clostridia bacterium]